MLPRGSERQGHRYPVSFDVAGLSGSFQARSARKEASAPRNGSARGAPNSSKMRGHGNRGRPATIGSAVGVWTTVARRRNGFLCDLRSAALNLSVITRTYLKIAACCRSDINVE